MNKKFLKELKENKDILQNEIDFCEDNVRLSYLKGKLSQIREIEDFLGCYFF